MARGCQPAVHSGAKQAHHTAILLPRDLGLLNIKGLDLPVSMEATRPDVRIGSATSSRPRRPEPLRAHRGADGAGHGQVGVRMRRERSPGASPGPCCTGAARAMKVYLAELPRRPSSAPHAGTAELARCTTSLPASWGKRMARCSSAPTKEERKAPRSMVNRNQADVGRVTALSGLQRALSLHDPQHGGGSSSSKGRRSNLPWSRKEPWLPLSSDAGQGEASAPSHQAPTDKLLVSAEAAFAAASKAVQGSPQLTPSEHAEIEGAPDESANRPSVPSASKAVPNASRAAEMVRSRRSSICSYYMLEDLRTECMQSKHTATAFERMSHNGVIPREATIWALQLAGFPRPNTRWVDDAVASIKSGLSRDQFAELVGVYDARQQRHLRATLNRAVAGAQADLAPLLRELGLPPFPWVLKELNQEAFSGEGSVAHDGSEDLLRVCDLLRDSAGFSRTESADLHVVFARCDRDRDGRLDPAGVRAALSWLGATADVPAALEPLTSDSQSDGGAKSCAQLPVSEAEFMLLVRACRVSEQRRLHAAFSAGNCDWFGTIDFSELPRIFDELGLPAVSSDVLREFSVACGFGHPDELALEDVHVLLERLRKAQCFGDAETKDIADAFARYDLDDAGSIDHAGLTGAVRWLGYPTTTAGITRVEEDLWLDQCSRLYFHECVRFVAEFRDREAWYLRKVLEEHDHRLLPPDKLQGVIEALGYTPTPEQVAALLGCRGRPGSRPGSGRPEGHRAQPSSQGSWLDFWELMWLVSQHRLKAREKARQNDGLDPAEVGRLRWSFQKHDQDGIGVITGEDFESMFQDFPEQHGAIAKARAEALVHRIGGGIWGRVTFKDVLRVARLLQDYADRDFSRKEQCTLEELGLSVKELEGFREVFQMFSVRMPGFLDFKEFKGMLLGVAPYLSPTEDEDAELLCFIADVMSKEGLPDRLDFPDFLRVMRRLQDEDWRGINSAAATVAGEVWGSHRRPRASVRPGGLAAAASLQVSRFRS